MSELTATEFVGVWEQYRGKIISLIRYCYCERVDRAVDYEDILQETFLRAWRARHTYRGDSSVYSWMCSIARKTTYQWMVSRSAWKRGSLVTHCPVDEARDKTIAPKDGFWVDFTKAFRRLTPYERKFILARAFGKDYAEIVPSTPNDSRVADVRNKVLRVKVCSARRRLRAALAGEKRLPIPVLKEQ